MTGEIFVLIMMESYIFFVIGGSAKIIIWCLLHTDYFDISGFIKLYLFIVRVMF